MTSGKKRKRFENKPKFDQELEIDVTNLDGIDGGKGFSVAEVKSGIALHSFHFSQKLEDGDIDSKSDFLSPLNFALDEDRVFQLCYELLKRAGLYNEQNQLEEKILDGFIDKLGGKLVNEFKSEYGENCSLVFLGAIVHLASKPFEPEWYAATILIKIFIQEDYYTAGFLASELGPVDIQDSPLG